MVGKTREQPAQSNGTSGPRRAVSNDAIEQLASPEDLRAYEEIAPGSADKLLELLQRQSEHRRDLEQRGARTSQRRDYLNLVLVTVVTLGVFGASTWLVSTNHQVPGTIFGILALVGAFLMFLMFLMRRVRIGTE